MEIKINPEEQRTLFNDALQEKDYEQALHLISKIQDAGFPRLAFEMTARLDLAEALDREHEEEVALDCEKWNNYRVDNPHRINNSLLAV